MNVVESDTRLVAEACQGSVTAFEALVRIYEPRIRRMIYGMTHDVQLTQDLCQETFLSAYRALPRMSGKDLHFSSWIYRIALNAVRSEWRRRKHVTVVPFSQSSGNEDNQFDESMEDYLLVSEGQFEERIVKQDLVRRVLAQMPEASAMCLLLDAEGFTYNEIAEILHDSLSAVRSRLSRARQTFQRIYTNLDQEGRT
jgi:RNA polymerase sigma-70 factor (ECF subfamily)